MFASLERVLGESGGYAQQHPDWRVSQRQAVEAACSTEQSHVWVAEVDGVVTGFIAVQLDYEASIGDIHMIAVDPACQRNGVGALLTSSALNWIAGLDQGHGGGDGGDRARPGPRRRAPS